MIESADNIRMNNEKEPVESRIHIFFVRHGEPQIYGADLSPLSETGVSQVMSVAEYFNHRLKYDSGHKKTALYIHSDRPRAEQTARILAEEAQYYVNRNRLGITVAETATQHAFISSENTLTKVMDEFKKIGYPKEHAASLWLKMPEDQTEALGIRSSRMVANEAIQLISQLVLDARDIGERDTHLYYFLGTHETTLMALLYHLPPYQEFKIGFADFIEIETTRSTGPRLTYRHAFKDKENGGLIVDYWDDRGDLKSAFRQK